MKKREVMIRRLIPTRYPVLGEKNTKGTFEHSNSSKKNVPTINVSETNSSSITMDKKRSNDIDPLSDTKLLSTNTAKTRGKDDGENVQYNESIHGDTNLLSLKKEKREVV